MLKQKTYQFWFCTGSQDLYGDACLAHVAEHAQKIVEALNSSGVLPYEIIWKPTLITNELIRRTFNEANTDETCAGVITWMHTFSPAKSWILGLQEYRKPLLHLHTQFNQEIPYDTIDMDFMNENQSAHGGREFGHIFTRMGIERKIVVGHWSDQKVQEKIASWMRTAVGVIESSHVRVMRVADNMRNVAVTDGDKVEAQIRFGWEVDAYPVNEIAQAVEDVKEGEVNALVDEYYDKYDILLEGEILKNLKSMWQYRRGWRLVLNGFGGEKLPGHCYTLRRFGQPETAPWSCNPKTHGKRIWFRSGRRLEDGCDAPDYEDYDRGNEGGKGYFFYGRLYIQSCSGQRGYFAGSYAGSLSDYFRRSDQHESTAP